jgi:hypothetical protein
MSDSIDATVLRDIIEERKGLQGSRLLRTIVAGEGEECEALPTCYDELLGSPEASPRGDSPQDGFGHVLAVVGGGTSLLVGNALLMSVGSTHEAVPAVPQASTFLGV